MDDLPDPPALKQAIWIAFQFGRDTPAVLATRCTILNQAGPTCEPHLYAWGQLFSSKPLNDPLSIKVSAFVIPCRFVSYIGIGPELENFSGPMGDADRLWFNARDPSPIAPMSLAAIRATLAELSDHA